MSSGLGVPLKRTEDAALLRGEGRFVADIDLPGQAHMVMLRSPIAHGRVCSIETLAALALPGVLTVLTAEDAQADGLGDLPTAIPTKDAAGNPLPAPPRPLLCSDRVLFEGDDIACILAETRAAAEAALAAIKLEITPLPPVVEPGKEAATQLHPDNPDNLANWHEAGDREATEAAFAKAAQVVSLDLVNNRVLPAPMEPRACLGDYEAENRTYRLWTSSQGAHLVRDRIAGKALKVQPEALQVIIPDVGGAFGQKIFPYAEEALVLWASRKIGRPVKWVSTRAENLAHDTHGRDLRHRAELALDADGRILALRVDTVGNLGAYASLYGPMVQSFVHTPMLPGVYAIPVMHVRTRSYYTNTAPIDAYRGAGRPEASYLIERLVDAAARQTGRTPDAFRRLSFIPEAAMPYATCGGRTYDTGAFERVMDVALERADWAGRAERRAAAAAKGLLLGTGFACYIEACGGGGQEAATLTLAPDGRFELLIGTQDSGQGHRTAYAQVVADVLAIDAGLVTVRQGDTALIETGGGTGGSRSLPVGGPATRKAAEALLADLRGKAGALLQVEGETLRYDSGRFHREATGQTLSLAEIAAESGPVTAANLHRPQAATFPNGCHVAELTIDPATGQCCVTRYHVVDDFGRLVNPMLAEGQIIGGIAQGIGQALMEDARYDAETGAFISSGFATYAIPHASDLPRIDIAFENTPCTTNPLGIKGAGEAGTIGACGAIMNAVLDALAPLGIGHVDMPATPETLWRLIRDARNAQGFS